MAPKTKPSKNASGSNKNAIETLVAKYGLISTVTVAILGLIGTGITAYLGFLGIQTQVEKPIKATQTAEAKIIINATQTAIESSISEYSIVYPSCNCNEYIDPWEKVLIRLRWGGATAEKAEMGADFITQVMIINGKDFGDVKNYRRPAVYVKDPIVAGDPSNAWWVYWDIPIGRLDYDTNIDLTVELLAGVDTGWNVLPAGLIKNYQLVANLMEFPATQTAP